MTNGTSREGERGRGQKEKKDAVGKQRSRILLLLLGGGKKTPLARGAVSQPEIELIGYEPEC
jgi:hypothetical protein